MIRFYRTRRYHDFLHGDPAILLLVIAGMNLVAPLQIAVMWRTFPSRFTDVEAGASALVVGVVLTF